MKQPMQTPSYYCTWNTQNFGRPDAAHETDPAVFIGQDGAKKARQFLDEKSLCGENGLLYQFPAVRDQLLFVIDDGWDVPYDVHPDTQIGRFGSLELDPERFPSCTGTPAQRLAALTKRVKEAGWRGLGVWVAAQAAGETYETGFQTDEEMERYWRERLEWSRQAGVVYWKVDWGCRQFEPAWRKALCQLRDDVYPELVIEHCWPAAAPVNHVQIENGRQVSDGRFASWADWPEKWSRMLPFSDIFRSYDVLSQFAQVSTLDRLAYLLAQPSERGCIINCEDDVYIGAALGCAFGTLRSGLCGDIPGFDHDPQQLSRRLAEVDRAVNWQRIAPAFAIGTAPVYASEETVRDTCRFAPGETWMEEFVNTEIFQACPAILSRGIQLRTVEYQENEKPLLAACRYPSGAVALAAISHRMEDGTYRTPQATVLLEDIQPDAPVGLFGWLGGVRIAYAGGLGGRRLWAQDLAGGQEADITGQVRQEDGICLVPGELLASLCRDNQPAEDISGPGILLTARF